MKHLTLLLLSIPFLSFTLLLETTDFDKQLNEVATDFTTNIMDETKCTAASQKAASIADAISDAMNEDGVTKADLKKLEVLKKEAEAIEDFITAVGDLNGGFETVEKMNLANERIKGEISSVQKGDFCVDIITVKIGDFICYLAENNEGKMTTVNYKWKGPAGTKSGSGTINVFAKSVHPMYNNRKDPGTKELTFMGLTCKTK